MPDSRDCVITRIRLPRMEREELFFFPDATIAFICFTSSYSVLAGSLIGAVMVNTIVLVFNSSLAISF